jgi:hypothetical protein
VLNTHGSLPPLPQEVMVDKFWSVKRTQIMNVHVCVVQSTEFIKLIKKTSIAPQPLRIRPMLRGTFFITKIYEIISYSSVPDVNFHKNSSNRSKDAGGTYTVCMLRMLNHRLIATKLTM